MTKGIVVGIDGSEGAALALRWAAAEGKARQLPVTAVLAWGMLDQAQPVIGPAFDPDYDKHHAATALRTYIHEALDEDTAATISARPMNDLPARALLRAAHDADLLVVGGRGMGGFKALLVGSVSRQCLHHAPCPVAVIHDSWNPDPEAATRQIVVGVDGSQTGHVALQWAVAEAQARDAQLDVVNVWNVPNAYGYPYVGIAFEPAPFEQTAHNVLAQQLVDADVAGLSHIPTRTAIQGYPAKALLEHAKDADLIVIGSRGLGGFKGLMLGSVSDQITQHATCPVVVVPPRS